MNIMFAQYALTAKIINFNKQYLNSIYVFNVAKPTAIIPDTSHGNGCF